VYFTESGSMTIFGHQFLRLAGKGIAIAQVFQVNVESQVTVAWDSPSTADPSAFGINAAPEFYKSEAKSNPFLRVVGSQRQCSNGAVITIPRGREIHPNGELYTFTHHTREFDCRTECTFGHQDSGGAWTCKAEGFPDEDFMHCGCEECPCNPGVTGFRCSQCATDQGCLGNSSCRKSLLSSSLQPKTGTCTFTDPNSAMIKTFWPAGLSHPFVLINFDPVSRSIQIDIVQNLCSKLSPVVTQCTCSVCSVVQDKIDPVSGQRTGRCKDYNVPNPCWECGACTCHVAEDSYMYSSIAGIFLQAIQKGAIISCEPTVLDNITGASKCVGVFLEFPLPLEMRCTAGYCSTFEEVFVSSAGEALESWARYSVICAGVAYFFALLVLLDFLRWRRRMLHCAAEADISPPPGHSDALQLSWSGVTSIRGTNRVLDQVSGSLQCADGQGLFVAIEGHSGSGKTTMLEVLAGRWSWGTQGTVSLNGVNHTPENLRRIVSFVPQSETLSALLTVREVLEFSAALRLRSLSQRERAGRVSWALTRLGLLSVASSQIGSVSRRGVSGGERRRAAIGVELCGSTHPYDG